MATKTEVKFLFALLMLFVSCGEAPKKNEPMASETSQSLVEKEATKNVQPLIKINDIVGKSLSKVEKILGKAESLEKARPSGTPCKVNPCDKAYFKSGKYEIVFINKKADWITINDVSEYTLDENVITILGLNHVNPSFRNQSSVLRWDNIQGINEISFFNNGANRLDYIYIKAFTK